MTTTFLITGGAGFIGSHLCLNLLERGYHVKVLDNFSTSSREKFEELIGPYRSSVELVVGDVRERIACKVAVRGAEYILHHAAMASVQKSILRPDVCVGVNVSGTTNVLLEAVNAGVCKRFVFASSSAVYGEQLPETKSEAMTPDPLSPYASSKVASELLCRNFTQIQGLPTVSLRYFNVFGERQDPNGPYAAVIPQFIRSIMDGVSPTIYGDGEQSRDFVSIDDVVQANLRACLNLTDSANGRAVNIGSGRRTTLNELVDVLATIIGRSVAPTYLPERAGDIKHSLSDISLAAKLLEYAPTVSLKEGLTKILGKTG